MSNTKEEILVQTIMPNIERKSVYVDSVQMHEGNPLFSWLEINPTELCNRLCTFCPRVEPDEYPNQNLNMSVDLAKKIANELNELNYKGGVVFSGYGEPLLNPDIQSIIKEFGDIYVEVITNGDSLNEEKITGLFESGLDTIVVSLYDGEFQIDKFHKLFKAAGISEEKYILRNRWFAEDVDFGVLLTNRSGKAKNGNQSEVDPMRACYYTHYQMMIDWNGDVMLCVQDWNKKVKFGNLFSNSLLDSWRSNALSKYRKTLGKGFRKDEPCKSCNVIGTLHGTNHAKTWQSQEHR